MPFLRALGYYVTTTLLILLASVLLFDAFPAAAERLPKFAEVVGGPSYGKPQDVPQWVRTFFLATVIGFGLILAMTKQRHRILYGLVELLFVWRASEQWLLITASSTRSIDWMIFIALLYVASRGFDNMIEGCKAWSKARRAKKERG